MQRIANPFNRTFFIGYIIERITGHALPIIKRPNHTVDNLRRAFKAKCDVGRIDEKIGRMITGLGFTLEELDRPVGKFSGGWQMRINLAKVLLQEADVILMDEPTNHLDMAACEWLEDFLKNYPKGILVVSQSR